MENDTLLNVNYVGVCYMPYANHTITAHIVMSMVDSLWGATFSFTWNI